jgi:hypothetical protein
VILVLQQMSRKEELHKSIVPGAAFGGSGILSATIEHSDIPRTQLEEDIFFDWLRNVIFCRLVPRGGVKL